MSVDLITERLKPYGACDVGSSTHLCFNADAQVADALLRLGVAGGGFIPGVTLRTGSSETKLIGRAYTVRFDKKPEEGRGIKKTSEGHYIDRVPPNTILVSSAPSDVSQAILGGLMALRLRKIGALGAIIDGRVRDLAELRQVGLPVFSRGVGISAATAVVYPSELDVAVQICLPDGGSITVQPGQIIVGDENGVAVIPSHLEEEVVELLPKLLEQDDEVRRALEEGRTAGEAFKLRNL